MFPKLIFFSFALVLATCDPQPGSGPKNICDASGLQHLVSQPARVLELEKFGGDVRIIRPGEAVTMEYVPGRMIIQIDQNEIIATVYCG